MPFQGFLGFTFRSWHTMDGGGGWEEGSALDKWAEE